ncbi:MAG TPA: response regulator, partial [Puia sp.]|nr:response regulator [Puia sp.]
IRIESVEDEGTTVYVTLPFGKDHLPSGQTSDVAGEWEDIHSGAYIVEAAALLETSTPAAKETAGYDGRETLLVVDDNADMNNHIRSLLERDFRVVTASNGKEALEKIASVMPHLVLSDIMMPEMDGIQLLKELRKDRRTSELPVIFLTARAGEESRLEGLQTGADDYLVKPFTANELLSRVRTQISIGRKRAEARRQIAESEHRLEEEVAKRTFQLIQANKELESFNYIASHDLQEPLRKIQTFILLLDERRNEPGAWEKYAAKIKESSQRMAQLIQSVLEYSRLSQAPEAIRETDLNTILENVMVDYELIIRESNADIQSDKLPVVEAIPLQMHQLFSNLISNAIKFSGPCPEIRISSDIVTGDKIRVSPGGTAKLKYAEIRFADNGIGFEPQYADRIFKLFQRLHSKSEFTGTGVGLSIVAKIVKNHLGSVLAESGKGRGAVFTVWLPLKFQGGANVWQEEI